MTLNFEAKNKDRNFTAFYNIAMKKNAKYWKLRLSLNPVKCNGYLKLHYDKSPDFNFAYYLIEKNIYVPWHRMASCETCHFIDGDPISILYIKEGALLSETLSQKNLDFFIEAGTWCAFFLPLRSRWTLISHFHFPAYREELAEYATAEQFDALFPHLSSDARAFGLKQFYNKDHLI